MILEATFTLNSLTSDLLHCFMFHYFTYKSVAIFYSAAAHGQFAIYLQSFCIKLPSVVYVKAALLIIKRSSIRMSKS